MHILTTRDKPYNLMLPLFHMFSKRVRPSFRTIFLVALLFSLIGGVTFIYLLISDLPKLDKVEDYRPPQISHLYDRNDHLIAEFYIQKRTVIATDKIPKHVKQAFLAAEDANFYEHKGIDYQGLLRAVINEVKYRIVGGKRIGGSTITQQCARDMLLSKRQTYTRKIKEAILARRIEKALDKDEILGLYLNQIYFGHGVYGIEEAAQMYYARSAKDLTLGQASALAGIPKSPNRINPIANPERLLERKTYVLDRMLKNDMITKGQVRKALKEPLYIPSEKPKYLGQAPHYAEAVRRHVIKEYGQDALFYDSLHIQSPIDIRYQLWGQQSLQKGLISLEKRHGYKGAYRRFSAEHAEAFVLKLDDLYEASDARDKSSRIWDFSRLVNQDTFSDPNALKNSFSFKLLKKEKAYVVPVASIDDSDKTAVIHLGSTKAIIDFDSLKWARPYNPLEVTKKPNKLSDVLQVGDLIWVKIIRRNGALRVSLFQKPSVDGALIAIDPSTHRVRALIGGYDFSSSKYNRATQAKRQPGSSIKPFIYSLAIDKGLVTPSSILTDVPRTFFEKEHKSKWKPRNHNRRFLGDITLRTCITGSINTCSIALLERSGITAFRAMADNLHIKREGSFFPKDLTLALGSADVVPLDFVNAYTIFPNQGRLADPILIEKIESQDGTILFEAPETPEETQVIKPESAYVMTHLLRGILERPIGKPALVGVNQPLAGKTGTSNEMRNVWFVGFSPDLVAGVYVGFDSYKSLGPREYSVKNAKPIWRDFMQKALSDAEAKEFIIPENITFKIVDKKSGLLADPETYPQNLPPEESPEPALSESLLDILDGIYEENSDVNLEIDEPKELPYDHSLPKTLLKEAYISGTEPTQVLSQEPDTPLEMLELETLEEDI